MQQGRRQAYVSTQALSKLLSHIIFRYHKFKDRNLIFFSCRIHIRTLADFFNYIGGEDEDERGNPARGRPRENGGRHRRSGNRKPYSRGGVTFKRHRGDIKAVSSGPGLMNNQRIH